MKELMEALRLKIDSYIDKGLLPSASLGILDNDRLYTYQKGYMNVVNSKQPLEDDPIYDLASLSKVTVTVMLILKLIEYGKLSLDTKVKDILLDFNDDNITILHLLIHTSGLPADDKDYKQCVDKKSLYGFINHLPKEPLNDKVIYSCFNYLLLGFIIDQLEENMEIFAKEVLFEPLNMTSTCYNPQTKGLIHRCVATELSEKRGLIRGEVHDGKAFIAQGVAGNAGVFSTVSDLAKLTRMILDNGVYQDRVIFNEKSISMLDKCYTKDLNESRSLGWFYKDKRCEFTKNQSRCLYHTGFTGTSMYIDLDRRLSIILLTNRVHPTRENMHIAEFRSEIHSLILNYIDNQR